MKLDISYKQIWNLAYPIVLSTSAQTLVNIIDTIFLGRVGEIELGAAAIGGIFYFIQIFICLGLGVGLQVLVARRTGEGEYHEIGKIFNHGIKLLLIVASLLWINMKISSGFIFHLFLKSELVAEAALEYLSYLSFGIIFVAINVLFRSLYNGTGQTAVIAWSTLVTAVVNILLDYGLIFGNWGMPKMGITGAGLATYVAEIAASVFLVLYSIVKKDHVRYNLYKFKAHSKDLIRKIFRLSYPAIIFYLFAFGGWFVFFVIIEQLGERALAISNIIKSLSMMVTIFGVGFAFASNTLVSNVIGQGKIELVPLLIKRIATLSFLLTIVGCIIIFLFPRQIVSIYTRDISLINDSLGALKVMLFGVVLFSVSTVLFNSLTGAGDTRSAMLVEAVSVFLSISSAFVMVHYMNVPIEVVWFAEVIYWVFIGLLAYNGLRKGKWKQIKL